MSKFKRKMKRHNPSNLAVVPNQLTHFELGGHLINQKAKELSTDVIERATMDAYKNGVQAGVEKSTKFALKCIENAIAETSGIGDKRKEAFLDNFRNNFNNTEEFTKYLREQNIPRVHTLYIADEQTERDLVNLSTIRNILLKYHLTIDTLLSTIESNPSFVDSVLTSTYNREEEIHAPNQNTPTS